MNPDKTDGNRLCAGINTTPSTAYADMQETKRRYGKMDKRLGYHIVQSFAPGEITPDDALCFGMEFVEKYLGNRYKGVAAVHIDKVHVHVHIVFDSVSYVDGRKFHTAKGEYVEYIRAMCDEQCRAWGLSVIEGDFTVRKTTKDEARSVTQNKPSCRDIIRADIDRYIGIQVNYFNILAQMRKLRERKHYRYSPALRAEIRKQEQWDEDLRFQEKYGITNIEELEKYKQDNLAVIAAITQQSEEIYRERRRAVTKNNPTCMSELDEELQKYKTVLAGLRRENRIAERIRHRLEEKVQAMLATEEAQMQIEKEIKMERRCSTRPRTR